MDKAEAEKSAYQVTQTAIEVVSTSVSHGLATVSGSDVETEEPKEVKVPKKRGSSDYQLWKKSQKKEEWYLTYKAEHPDEPEKEWMRARWEGFTDEERQTWKSEHELQ